MGLENTNTSTEARFLIEEETTGLLFFRKRFFGCTQISQAALRVKNLYPAFQQITAFAAFKAVEYVLFFFFFFFYIELYVQLLIFPAGQSEHLSAPASWSRWCEPQTAYRRPSTRAQSAFPGCRSARGPAARLLPPPLWASSPLLLRCQLPVQWSRKRSIKRTSVSYNPTTENQ